MKPLRTSFHEKVWGSRRLSPWFADSEYKVGEVWFEAPPEVPLLVKFLFTTENLSVQVHPTDEYARAHHGGSNGKTEMWRILRAEPGARIALGLERDVTAEELREASLSGAILDLLHWITVKPGDTYYTPAGTIHAIGAGVALCEIQQISEITYRLYDYGRPRQLHLDHGVAVSDRQKYSPAELSACPYFATLEAACASREVLEVTAPAILIALEGSGGVNGVAYRLGGAYLVSENTLRINPAEPSRFLITRVPTRYS